jgi:hypothetical protein
MNGKPKTSATESTTVFRSEFARDPGKYVADARSKGAVTITDGRGKPRMMIVAPKAIVGYDD